MKTDDDLEAYWADIRPNTPTNHQVRVDEVVGAFGGREKMLREAFARTVRRLTAEIDDRYTQSRAPLTGALLADVVVSGISMFMQEWRAVLSDTNLAGLLGVVLSTDGLTADELTGFIRALPQSVLERIAASAVNPATGTHALVSLEVLRRSHDLAYTISVVTAFADGPRVQVRTIQGARTIEFFLDEEFTLPTERPV